MSIWRGHPKLSPGKGLVTQQSLLWGACHRQRTGGGAGSLGAVPCRVLRDSHNHVGSDLSISSKLGPFDFSNSNYLMHETSIIFPPGPLRNCNYTPVFLIITCVGKKNRISLTLSGFCCNHRVPGISFSKGKFILIFSRI